MRCGSRIRGETVKQQSGPNPTHVCSAPVACSTAAAPGPQTLLGLPPHAPPMTHLLSPSNHCVQVAVMPPPATWQHQRCKQEADVTCCGQAAACRQHKAWSAVALLYMLYVTQQMHVHTVYSVIVRRPCTTQCPYETAPLGVQQP